MNSGSCALPGLQLSAENLPRILQKCAKDRDRALALRLHAYMRENRLETHHLLGNHLIPMLVDVGSMRDAQQIFDKFQHPNEWTWTSLINGYLKLDKPKHALKLYHRMLGNASIQPSGHTFVAAIKASTKLKDLEQGTQIHAEVDKRSSLKENMYIGNTLIDMYAKCGSLEKAKHVFNKLPAPGVVSWNALITAYIDHGQANEAVNCFEALQLDGISPNVVTFLCTLKACASIKAAGKGLEIHSEIERQGLMECHALVGTTLVDMYGKCGLLKRAREVFNKIQLRDVIAWTALITCYTEQGHGMEAVECYEDMHHEGVLPNAFTYICCLKACGTIGAVEKGQKVHAEVVKAGLVGSDILVGTALIYMYCKLGLFAKAHHLFGQFPARDLVSWNALLSGYAEQGHGDKTLACYEQMQDEGIMPDDVTYVCSLKACGSMLNASKGQEIHDQIEKQGLLASNLIVGNALLDMYLKCGLLTRAQEAFDKFPVRDVITWTSLIAGYVEHGQGEEALECFEKMQVEGISPNSVTFICSVQACGDIGATHKAVDIHGEIERHGLLGRDPLVGTSLVDMYSKCGMLEKARQVFHRLLTRDDVSWTALMSGHAQYGEAECVLHVYDQMLEQGIRPNVVTFVVLLTVCRRGCLWNKSQTYFETMSKQFGIAPTLEHHTCMVSILGCAGQLEKAEAMIKKSPFGLDNVGWHTVLGVCKHLGSLEFGKEAFGCVLAEDVKAELNTT